ncbi:hypothetical protein [Trinickia symbiotica]|uniref:hypothetical protein n=1 Tax=Trinickia symbiotica TaxID=863227 RepID=UPI0011B1D623|nr:hypothetical protein [Trinickia symbiotica]
MARIPRFSCTFLPIFAVDFFNAPRRRAAVAARRWTVRETRRLAPSAHPEFPEVTFSRLYR